MTKVFISGSVGIRALDPIVQNRLGPLMADKVDVLIGDAAGVDTVVQEYLNTAGYRSVTVYSTGSMPRHNVGRWSVVSVEAKSRPGTREYFTAKDEKMAADCDLGLCIWDGKSSGTRRNAIQLVQAEKPALVYFGPIKRFHEIRSDTELESLMAFNGTDLK
jgi:hypothetical protein